MQFIKRLVRNTVNEVDISAQAILRQRKNHHLRVIICGLPRSGTSFLTGLVSNMGYRLGPERWLKRSDANNKFGYFENLPLNILSEKIMGQYDADFIDNPIMPDDWLDKLEIKYGEKIKRIVNAGEIELYKDNRLIILADLYARIFPEAKWIFIQRSIESTYNSRFGESVTPEKWQDLTVKRLNQWRNTKTSNHALSLQYEDFSNDLESQIQKISSHLEKDLTDKQLIACRRFYQPKKK